MLREVWGSGGKPGRRVSPRLCELLDVQESRHGSGLPFLRLWSPSPVPLGVLCFWAAPLSGGCSICECASISSVVFSSLCPAQQLLSTWV